MKCQPISGLEHPAKTQRLFTMKNTKFMKVRPTAVDTETETMIQAALERLVQNRTTFAIAHRLSTLRKANRLIVLERGKMVEAGTHEELIESGGLYCRLCKLQSELSKMTAW